MTSHPQSHPRRQGGRLSEPSRRAAPRHAVTYTYVAYTGVRGHVQPPKFPLAIAQPAKLLRLRQTRNDGMTRLTLGPRRARMYRHNQAAVGRFEAPRLIPDGARAHEFKSCSGACEGDRTIRGELDKEQLANPATPHMLPAGMCASTVCGVITCAGSTPCARTCGALRPSLYTHIYTVPRASVASRGHALWRLVRKGDTHAATSVGQGSRAE